MTKDQVIEYAKDWVYLCAKARNIEFCDEDVLNACIDLAYFRTREALIAYTKEREEHFAAHDRLLDSIEATLQQEFRNGV